MRIFHYIYVLPWANILLLMPFMFLLSIIFVCVVQRFVKKTRKVYVVFLLTWVAVVVYETLINRVVGDYLLSLKPFESYMWALEEPEYYRANFMNILLFFPGGMFLGLAMFDNKVKLVRVCTAVLALMGMSICIELLQYVLMRGTAEVDDVMHNTLGAVFGCAGAVVVEKIVRLFLGVHNTKEK